MDTSYESAIRVLNGRKRLARPKVSPASQPLSTKDGIRDLRGTPSLTGMREWLAMLGHSAEDINALNVIHIAGTKGKGSTCAFTESILRSHGQRTGFPRKTGLYTSPHLIHPEERIRINARPLDRELFAKYFFEVYKHLPQLASDYDMSKSVVERGPRYLQLFALFALHVFIREKVEGVILETHNGGEYDATNVVARPVVTAITTLGMDHIDMLGPTIENIAWHKSGIYKSGAVALSAIHDDAPSKVLVSRAQAQGEVVRFVGIDPRLPEHARQLQPAVQKQNASLAVSISQAFIEKTASAVVQSPLSDEDISNGVSRYSWPGRFQVVTDEQSTWFLDAAHNEMSVAIAAQWFAETSMALTQQPDSPTRTLIFAHVNIMRDSVALLRALAQALKTVDLDIQHVIITTYEGGDHAPSADSSAYFEEFRQTLAEILPSITIWEEPTIQGAMKRSRTVRGNEKRQHTLITGSQHLVGPALCDLQDHGADVSLGD